MSDNALLNNVGLKFDLIYESDDDDDEREEQETRVSPSVSRYVPISPNELGCIANSRHEPNTLKQTTWAVSCFEAWLKERNIKVDFETITKPELGSVLREFYATIRTAKGDMYGISSYAGLRAGLNRHINEPPVGRAWNLMQDTEFTAANNVFRGILKQIRKAGKDRSNHHPIISPGDLNILKTSAALQPNSPKGLLHKVWFDIQLHFGRRGCEGNRNLKPDSFVLKRDERGRQYFTMAFNGETKNHTNPLERSKDNYRGAMYEEPGNPLCPVASLTKYLSKIPTGAKALYLQPKRTASPYSIWYTNLPLGINQLGQMLPRLCLEAGTTIRYTNHSLRATAIQMRSDAGLAAREIMSASAHR